MKKPSVLSFLITLLFLAAAVCIGGETVKDSAGDSLVPGQSYYIKPVNTNGGGLVPSPPTLVVCPLGVAQTVLDFIPGVPVSFSFPHKNMESSRTISTDDYVTIEFKSKFWLCPGTKFWRAPVVATENPFLLVGGEPSDPETQFKIENAEQNGGPNTYKLTSTSSHLSVGSKTTMLGVEQLVFTNGDKPLLFKFKKFDDATTTAATTSSPSVEKLSLRLFPF